MNNKSCALHPPLRVHISKRDAKSFFLHWIPNPLNQQRAILGYRIYIDDVLKDSIDPGKCETIIDCIDDEGEYRIKLRTYDANDESEDSNVIIARFRRQDPTKHRSNSNPSETRTIQRTQSDHVVNSTSHTKSTKTPLRQTQSQENVDHSSSDEAKEPIIMNKQQERMNSQQFMLSSGFPLLIQQHRRHQTELSTTPDKKMVN